jgi:hypothetical protein
MTCVNRAELLRSFLAEGKILSIFNYKGEEINKVCDNWCALKTALFAIKKKSLKEIKYQHASQLLITNC